MDLSALSSNPMTQIIWAVLTLAGGYRLWRMQSSGDAKERADSAGQIAALAAWQELLDSERAARVRAEERADKFAQERNDAMQQVFEMKGQLSAMNENLSAQGKELTGLRDQVRQLKEQLNAH